MRIWIALVLAAFLAACATATPYQPAVADGGDGYVERQIEQNRYSVSFSGNIVTERETVETYLLYRAAELTIAKGYDYFIVANRLMDAKRTYHSFGPTGFYPGFYPNYMYYGPHWGWRHYYDPFYDDVTIRETVRYQAAAEIVMFKGRKPAADPHAFDARDVQASLAPKVQRPAPK